MMSLREKADTGRENAIIRACVERSYGEHSPMPYASPKTRACAAVWEVAAGARRMERVKGIEPSYAAWEAAVLPLNYAREIVKKADCTPF